MLLENDHLKAATGKTNHEVKGMSPEVRDRSVDPQDVSI